METGFYCLNSEQPNGKSCSDFAVSFCCPVEELTCEEVIEEDLCPDNKWCLETAQGPMCKCGDDDFSSDPDNNDFIQYEDGLCVPVNSPVTKENVTGTMTCVYEFGDCTQEGYDWTIAVDMDDPLVGYGDYELLSMIPERHSCANPTGIKAMGIDAGGNVYGTWPLHADLNIGFWCVNDEQDSGTCADFQVSFCCPKSQVGTCDEGYAWSWFTDTDDPSGVGDWESANKLVHCENPVAVRAETVWPTATFDDYTHISLDKGFWCINEENSQNCVDYKISFCCPTLAEGTCDTYGHQWDAWLDSDDPDGYGDIEAVNRFSEFDVCADRSAVRAQINDGLDESGADTIISVEEGFQCENGNKQCNDYEVSFCCPKYGAGDVHCNQKGYKWTNWLDNDDPDNNQLSTGDWETRTAYAERDVCSHPIGVQAVPLDDGSTHTTHINGTLGFWCINMEQPGYFSQGVMCADFAVRFCCPEYTESSCDDEGFEWTQWLDRDDPTEEGDYETRLDFPAGDVCDNPIALDSRPRTSGSTEVTHNHLYHGFWCNNEEQSEGDCADFEVRFCCPTRQENKCDEPGFKWTVWLDRDDPTDSGDWENRNNHPVNVVCLEPNGIEVQKKEGSYGSDAVVHFDNVLGFWCINDEQPKDQQCADFEIRYCCPEEYFGK